MDETQNRGVADEGLTCVLDVDGVRAIVLIMTPALLAWSRVFGTPVIPGVKRFAKAIARAHLRGVARHGEPWRLRIDRRDVTCEPTC